MADPNHLGGWEGPQIGESTYSCRSTMHFVGLETTMKHMFHSGHLLHKASHRDRNLFHLFILEFLDT